VQGGLARRRIKHIRSAPRLLRVDCTMMVRLTLNQE